MTIKFSTRLKSTPSLVDMTPLVDVIFLMLIFFIVTSDILPLKSLRIENPVLEKDSSPLTSQLLLVVDAQHVIYLGSKKAIVDLSSLKDSLNQELQELKDLYQNTEPTVVLSLDRRVDYGLFLKIFATVQECCPRLRLVYRPANDESI